MPDGDERVFPGRGPVRVRDRQFARVRKGYDPEQVRTFLAQIADRIEGLEAELRSAREEMTSSPRPEAPAGDESYQDLATRMADMLQTADRHAEDIRRAAEQEAERLRGEASADADRMRTEAEAEADRIRQEAKAAAEEIHREASAAADQLRTENDEAMRRSRTEAEHIVSVLSSRKDMLMQEVKEARDRLKGVLEKVNEAFPPAPEG